MSLTVCSTPPFIADSTCTASLPERRKTPSHRSCTLYVSSSFIPTMLEPAPMPERSVTATLCCAVLGNFGSTVSAKSIFSVLAGGSRQCALWAASTSPDSASVTIQERAVTSLGSTGTPLARLTWVPARPSRAPPTVDIFAGGVTEGLALGEGPVGEGLGAASATGAVSARDDRTAAEVTSRDRPMVFFWGADTFRNVHGAEGGVPPLSPPGPP